MGAGLPRMPLGAFRMLAGALLLLAAVAAPAQERAPADSGNDALSLLLDQNNQMRAELQALRALVEEQQFELRRLRRDSLDRYTNMDERLLALESGAPAGAPDPDADSSARTAPGAANTPPTVSPAAAAPDPAAAMPDPAVANAAPALPARGRASTLRPAVLSEQQLYQMAYESAINENFQRAIAEFDQYLSVYPAGRFVANAHYWKGQSYLYLSRFDEAKAAYEIILNEHGDSLKVPDAMYGLGQAFEGLGDTPRARDLYNGIKRRYPNTGVANLADSNLRSLD